MTRIIAGSAGSLRLAVPPAGTRPTSDRVREAIFSKLGAWGMLEGTAVLDLYAGSGALGLEAASRGAVSVTLVEKHAPAAKIIEANAKLVSRAIEQAGDSVTIRTVRAAAQTFLDESASTPLWDVVLIDPPYNMSATSLTENLGSVAGRLTDSAVVMVEQSSRSEAPDWPASLHPLQGKRYGDTTLWWAEKAS